jgi:hypothetical protein
MNVQHELQLNGLCFLHTNLNLCIKHASNFNCAFLIKKNKFAQDLITCKAKATSRAQYKKKKIFVIFIKIIFFENNA